MSFPAARMAPLSCSLPGLSSRLRSTRCNSPRGLFPPCLSPREDSCLCFLPFQVSQEDTRAQFLIPVGSLGRNRAEASLERAQNLNPMVDVKADPESVESKPEEFFTQFDAVRAAGGEKGRRRRGLLTYYEASSLIALLF